MLAEKGRRILQIAVRPRRLVDAPKRAADQRYMTVIGGGSRRDAVQPRHVRGEAAYRDPVLKLPE